MLTIAAKFTVRKDEVNEATAPFASLEGIFFKDIFGIFLRIYCKNFLRTFI